MIHKLQGKLGRLRQIVRDAAQKGELGFEVLGVVVEVIDGDEVPVGEIGDSLVHFVNMQRRHDQYVDSPVLLGEW